MFSFQQEIFKSQSVIPNFMVLNDLPSAGADNRFFNITNLTGTNTMDLEFTLINEPDPFIGSVYVQLGGLPSPPANELNFLNDSKVFTNVSVSNSSIFLISFGVTVTPGSTAVVRCRVLSSNIDSIPTPDFIDITIVRNTPPTVDAGLDDIITLPVTTSSATGTANDPDGTIVSLNWTQVSGPSTATIVNGTTLTPTFNNLTDVGTYTFQLEATDNQGGVSSDTMDVIVAPAPPSLTLISNIISGGVRTQVFEVGPNISLGNKFNLTVYSYTNTVTVTEISATPASVASDLSAAINSTTLGEWNSFGSAPPNGTNGYPPSASFSGNQVTIVLNTQNIFAGTAQIS